MQASQQEPAQSEEERDSRVAYGEVRREGLDAEVLLERDRAAQVIREHRDRRDRARRVDGHQASAWIDRRLALRAGAQRRRAVVAGWHRRRRALRPLADSHSSPVPPNRRRCTFSRVPHGTSRESTYPAFQPGCWSEAARVTARRRHGVGCRRGRGGARRSRRLCRYRYNRVISR